MKYDPNSRIMSIDPGMDVGFATYTHETYKAWQFRTDKLDWFLQELTIYMPDIIVCESFDHRHKDNVNYKALEYIALTKWYAERRDLVLHFQTPSYGKGYFTPDKLKKLGLYVPGKDNEDAMTALKHLLQFQMDNGQFDLTKLK